MVSPSRRKNPASTIPIGRAFPPASIRTITAVIRRSHSYNPDPEISAPTSSNTADCHPSFHHTSGDATAVITTSRRSALHMVRLKSASVKLSISLTTILPLSLRTRPSRAIVLQVPRSRPEDLHKPGQCAQENPHNRNPALIKVPVQPAPHQPTDHAPGRQRNRQLNHR